MIDSNYIKTVVGVFRNGLNILFIGLILFLYPRVQFFQFFGINTCCLRARSREDTGCQENKQINESYLFSHRYLNRYMKQHHY